MATFSDLKKTTTYGNYFDQIVVSSRLEPTFIAGIIYSENPQIPYKAFTPHNVMSVIVLVMFVTKQMRMTFFRIIQSLI